MNKLERTRAIVLTPDLVARFWPKVDQSGGPEACWPWQGKTQNGGYGVIWFGGTNGTTMYAHRLSFMITHGIDPIGYAVCHQCDNPQCVNPAHLFLGTIKDNVQDMIAKGRSKFDNLRPGEDHPNAKLTEEQVVEIRARAAAGESSRVLGREFGLHHASVRQIIRGDRWKHVGGAR